MIHIFDSKQANNRTMKKILRDYTYTKADLRTIVSYYETMHIVLKMRLLPKSRKFIYPKLSKSRKFG